jgi:hypothetical protein
MTTSKIPTDDVPKLFLETIVKSEITNYCLDCNESPTRTLNVFLDQKWKTYENIYTGYMEYMKKIEDRKKFMIPGMIKKSYDFVDFLLSRKNMWKKTANIIYGFLETKEFFRYVQKVQKE